MASIYFFELPDFHWHRTGWNFSLEPLPFCAHSISYHLFSLDNCIPNIYFTLVFYRSLLPLSAPGTGILEGTERQLAVFRET